MSKPVAGLACAKVQLLRANRTETLKPRDDSGCLLFKRFSVGDTEVQLRIDWSDASNKSEPILDADFYRIGTGKRLNNKGVRKLSHNTNPSLIEGKRIYYWSLGIHEEQIEVSIAWFVVGNAVIDVAPSSKMVHSKKPK
ncbi:hypothetical protein HRJ45_12435 [Vibrio coralliilyticus]|uniref:hypothetical protein n=1 Tax=Vibrio coralliilyticus TaxID=190893 RepID=UPI00155FAB86|nr:hypothetical protein [Vibrio coralliilyticus]NRF25894.1 hypothetical protein [Vibrio coralliilyticus]NRF79917.1 hypothetical protein [Vibrio coralliilyticus]